MLLPSGDHAGAAQAPRDTAGLHFFGFRPGARLDELNHQLRREGGSPLRCRRSRRDGRVSECRGVLRPSEEDPQVDVWVSAIDSVAGIMTLSGTLDQEQLEYWRRTLQEQYGRVGTRIQGRQSMLQWVRRGRMIRLTWRLEGRAKVASVSLVDGHVLDNWGRTPKAGAPAARR
ncbi:MAG TPA: hypothetical protein VFZ87_04860 [Gemmatimonadales bacterium]